MKEIERKGTRRIEEEAQFPRSKPRLIPMCKYDKLLNQILRGTSDKNVAFEDLCQLRKHLGFEERIRGSHHIFRKGGVEEKINLQHDGSKAKAYQVRQVRVVILKHRLGGSD